MFKTSIRFFSCCCALLLGSSALQAQITTLLNANAKSYFAADSDVLAAQQSDPVGPTWGGAAGFGPYFAAPSNVPAAPPLPIYPSTLAPAYSFSAGHTSSFSYGLTNSTSTVSASPVGGFNVIDAHPVFNFTHNNPTPLYSYHQINLELDYLTFGPLGGMIFGVGAPLYTASGTTTGLIGNYAEFGAKLKYFWTPSDSAGVLTGSTTPIGFLDYVFAINNGGAYNAPVNATQSSNLNSAPITGFGVLSIVGYAYVAGDPASITLTPVPEPGTWALLVCGGLGLAWQARRRSKASG